jgi:hypothetical protein
MTDTAPTVATQIAPIKVKIGQAIEIDDGPYKGTTLRITDEGLLNAIANSDEFEASIFRSAECRQCHFTTELSAELGIDQSGFEFRCWFHEHEHPGHVLTYRNETWECG